MNTFGPGPYGIDIPGLSDPRRRIQSPDLSTSDSSAIHDANAAAYQDSLNYSGPPAAVAAPVPPVQLSQYIPPQHETTPTDTGSDASAQSASMNQMALAQRSAAASSAIASILGGLFKKKAAGGGGESPRQPASVDSSYFSPIGRGEEWGP